MFSLHPLYPHPSPSFDSLCLLFRSPEDAVTLLTAAQSDIIGANDVPSEVIRAGLTAGGGGLVLVLTQRTQHTLTTLRHTARWAWHCATGSGDNNNNDNNNNNNHNNNVFFSVPFLLQSTRPIT